MKNLKLVNFQQFDTVQADCFCSDLNGNVYFGACNSIFCLDNVSKVVSICAEIIPDTVETSCFIVEMEYIIETDNLFVASSSGEIYLYDIYSKEVSNVGHVDSGIEGFAWSPDQEFLILLTGSDSLILMTKELNAVTEKPLSSDDFGESKPITVGWGSKETQFHGSEGKEAAHIKKVEPKPALQHDDHKPRISWRGDGDYFVTSSIHSIKGCRQLRIWNRQAILQYSGEIKEGLEEQICWRPSGNIIACSQHDVDKHKIIFFEKNGLQHGEFSLPFKPKTNRVICLSWNSDSNILLVVTEEICECPEVFQVMLWTCSNYHWYLKQYFKLKNLPSHKKLKMKWNLYQPMELNIYNPTTSDFILVKWISEVCRDENLKSDNALAISVDNDNILVTPFDKMLVPPPLCAYSYSLSSEVQAVCFSISNPAFCCFLQNTKVVIFCKDSGSKTEASTSCKLKLVAAGGNGFLSKVQPYSCCGVYSLNVEKTNFESPALCHWMWLRNHLICICYDKQRTKKNNFCVLTFELPEQYTISEQILSGKSLCELKGSAISMCSNADGSVIAVQLDNGTVLRYETNESNSSKQFFSPWLCEDRSNLIFPQICPTMSIISISGKDFVLGLTERYSLFCNNTLLLSNCTSYFIHHEYLLATTTDHMLKFFLKDLDVPDIMKNSQPKIDIPVQKIEKGAKIIIAPFHSTKVVLQMPRGNLETIHPRPLVLSSVCKYLDELKFGKAFDLSKVHRIDLNILFDHNPKQFLENISKFIEQLDSPSKLNLFLANLKNEDVCETLYSFAYKGKQKKPCLELTKNKVNTLCDSFRELLEQLNDDRYYQSLIATYAKKSEPELDKALLRLKKLKDSSEQKNTQSLLESALNFLLYLVDVNDLIDVALGTYDLQTTIMVAQKSQKDPKEFLPFYNELEKLEENYKKYKIDMHLQRYKLALKNVSKCEDHFEECLSLIKNQRLYVDALYLYPVSSDKFKTIWKEYGLYLMEKKYYDEAGLVFTRCNEHHLALSAYQTALNWKSMLCSAIILKYSEKKVVELCQEMSEKLKSNHQFLDASYLMEHYVNDIEESIVILIDGCEWDRALLLISKYERYDIAETHLKPALIEHHSYISSYMDQLSKDFHKHLDRLKVLRSRTDLESELPEPVKFNEDELFSETGSVTDIASSCAESKQLSGSIMTRKSSKSGKKQNLKMYRLKKGSAHEDKALIAALSEIILKIDSLKDNFLNSLKALVQFDYDKFADELQKQMTALTALIEVEMPNIWLPTASATSELKFGPNSTSNSIAAVLSEKKNIPFQNLGAELSPPAWRKIDVNLVMFK